jgi:tetratricopeptide (TPR) repeat protein
MHLFNDTFQAIAKDLTKLGDEIEDFLFSDWYLTARSGSTCNFGDLHTIDDYNRAIKASPTDAALFYNRGIRRQTDGDVLGAISDYNLALSLAPRLAEAYAARATIYIHLDRLTDAIADCDRAIELHTDLPVVYQIRAISHSFGGNNDNAIADFTRFTQLDPSSVAYYNLGITQLTIGLYAPALANLTKSFELQPQIATYYARSVALAGLGDEFGTNRDYSAALSLETPGSGSLASNDEHAYYFRALARLARGGREEAKTDLQTTISICDRKHNSHLQQLAAAKITEIDRAATATGIGDRL